MLDCLRTALAGRLRSATQRGVCAVDYGLAIAGVCAVLAVAVFALGPLVREAVEEPCDPATQARCTP